MSGLHSKPPDWRDRRSRSTNPWLRPLVGLCATLLATGIATGGTWALMSNSASGGPEQFTTATLNPAPTVPTVSNSGCAGGNQKTNVGVSWTDTQSTTSDASGGSLVTGYSITRASTSGGTYAAAGSVTGSPSPTTFTDTPTVASTPVAIVANTAKQAYPLSESTLSAGTAITIGTVSNEVNAVQTTPDGLTAIVAEYTTGQIQILSWSGTAWSVVKTITIATPTAVAIDPVPNSSGYYVAYVVSDPGTTSNGSVYPVTLNGASSTLGTAIAVQHQANPTAIVVTPNGSTVYVANYNSSTASAITIATGVVTNIALPGTTAHPVALATTFDSSHVYVADRANGYIDDITTATNTVGTHVTLATGALNDTVVTTSGNPNLLAILPNGQSLYVAEFGTAEVQVVNTALAATPDTIAATVSTGSGSQPIDLAASPNGCLVYGADRASNKIFSIVTSTNVEASVFTTACQAQDPQPMQLTPDNQYLEIPENSSCGDIQVLNTGTNAVTTVTGVGTAPTMLAIPPVPLWYEATATHALWNSPPSTPVLFSCGWNPGGWQ
jgi:DNA-binding beta-propeller fold protein YncE